VAVLTYDQGRLMLNTGSLLENSNSNVLNHANIPVNWPDAYAVILTAHTDSNHVRKPRNHKFRAGQFGDCGSGAFEQPPVFSL